MLENNCKKKIGETSYPYKKAKKGFNKVSGVTYLKNNSCASSILSLNSEFKNKALFYINMKTFQRKESQHRPKETRVLEKDISGLTSLVEF
jgi:hypothetical protein